MIKRRLRATLPGSIFKRGRRWRWRVQLPGEPQEKVRSLIPEGERYGVTNLREAGPVALAMWQRAAEQEAQRCAREEARIRAIRRAATCMKRIREVRREAQKALARQQAMYRRRIEACRQQAESWAQRLQQAQAQVDQAVLAQNKECARRLRACKASAARARERAIARIRADANKTIAEQKTEFERKVRAYRSTMTSIWDQKVRQISGEAETRRKSRTGHIPRTAETPKKTRRKARRRNAAKAGNKNEVQGILESTAMQQVVAEYATANAEIRTQSEAELNKIITSIQRIAYCECCFHNGVREDALVRIDSGQRLCPTCMKALEAKEAEMDHLKQLPA